MIFPFSNFLYGQEKIVLNRNFRQTDKPKEYIWRDAYWVWFWSLTFWSLKLTFRVWRVEALDPMFNFFWKVFTHFNMVFFFGFSIFRKNLYHYGDIITLKKSCKKKITLLWDNFQILWGIDLSILRIFFCIQQLSNSLDLRKCHTLPLEPRDREKDRDRETGRQRETDRQTNRQRERDRERERQKKAEREKKRLNNLIRRVRLEWMKSWFFFSFWTRSVERLGMLLFSGFKRTITGGPFYFTNVV